MRIALPRRALLWVAVALAVAACENPVKVSTDHVEVVDMVLHRPDGTRWMGTVDNSRWDAEEMVISAAGPQELQARFRDFRGREVSLAGRRDHVLRVEVEDARIAVHEPLNDRERLIPLAEGRTRVRFLIWHVSHPDFVSPWLPLRVTSGSP